VATQPAVAEPEAVAEDAPLVEAKLVRAAKPVYPPNAMRSFITGDVRIAAEVGTNGHVGKVAVISGPAALREAAVEAMKQYEYEPATKGGKAVASQVKVTIKFWFDP
jgi:protein TonB